MNTEQATDYFLQHLLGSVQDGRIFVEVGLGSCDWSFQWAVKTGLRCVAVEPLPVPMLRAACQAEGVLLIEAAVGCTAGEAVMHHGELNGFGIPDTSSTRADWWAVGGKTTTVPMLSLQDVIHRAGEGAIACLKVDVEGAEAEVLQGLLELEETRLPQVVAFEYGGGGPRQSGSGGWSQESLGSTEQCLIMLRERDYSWGLVCEKNLVQPQVFKLEELSTGLVGFLLETFEVGNLIVCRSEPPADLERTLKTFRRRDWWYSWRKRWTAYRSLASFQTRRYRSAILRRVLLR